jgi:hypothetical protein
LKEDAVKGLPEYIRERALKLVQNNKQESTMTIQGNEVYYEIIAQEKEEVSKGITKVDDPAVQFVSNMSISTSHSPLKILKIIKQIAIKKPLII